MAFAGRMENTPTPIGAAELNSLLSGPQPPVLLDARLAEDCDCATLPGACNNCVYEVAFCDRMAGLVPQLTTPVCVFGMAADSLESRMAAEKLCRMGYSQVYDFRDGTQGWKAAGFPLVEFAPPVSAPPPVADGVHSVDLAASRIRWIGRNLLNHHEGSIPLKSGWLRFIGGRLDGGGFVIDMRGMTCADLAGDRLHDVLIHHLLSHDFFDSEKFPEAIFTLTGCHPLADATPGSPDLTLAGELTLKGVTRPLEFQACTGLTPQGKPAAQSTLAFDRTLWDVLYGSGRWFRNPGGHLVNDLIELQLKIVGA